MLSKVKANNIKVLVKGGKVSKATTKATTAK